MNKFGRVYSLKVEVDIGIPSVLSPALVYTQANKNVTITLPYTVEFEISRQNQSAAQTATFRVFNLGEETRNLLQKDYWRPQGRSIQFRAGYESPSGAFMPLVFNGQVNSAYSYRRGVDFITEIEAFDGGLAMTFGTVAFTQAAGATAADIVKKLSALMPFQTGTPIVGSFPATNKRGEVFFGNIWQLILQKTNGQACIDNGQVKALNPYEVIRGGVPLISSESGLLGSPKRSEQTLDFEMIFEPGLVLNQKVRLESSTVKRYNREWKVIGFDHRGTISPSVAGDCLTSVRLLFTQTDLLTVEGVAVQ